MGSLYGGLGGAGTGASPVDGGQGLAARHVGSYMLSSRGERAAVAEWTPLEHAVMAAGSCRCKL